MKRNVLFSKLSLTLLALILCATKTSDLTAMKIDLNCTCCNATNQVEGEQDKIKLKIYSLLQKERIYTEQLETYLEKLIERCAQRSLILTNELQPIIDALVKNNHLTGVLYLIAGTNSLILHPSRACLNNIIQSLANTNDNKLSKFLNFLANSRKNNTLRIDYYADLLANVLIKVIETSKLNALHNSKRETDLLYKLFSKKIETTPLANLYNKIKQSIEKTVQSEKEATIIFHYVINTTFSRLIANNKSLVGEFFNFVFIQTNQKESSLLSDLLGLVRRNNTTEEINFLLKIVSAHNRGETIS